MVPLVRPANPPTVLFEPVLVTAPDAEELAICAGPFSNVSVPMNPPSTLLAPPVTEPPAALDRIVPLPDPTRPPATLAAATPTLPLALELWISAAPFTQLMQTVLVATRPPAVLASPVCTPPSATDDWIVPKLLPTSPPACKFATSGLPTLPLADEPEISP